MLGAARVAILGRNAARAAMLRWSAAVVVNGGTVSRARQVLVTAYIKSLMASGAWPLIDDIYMLVAEDEPSALTSWKQTVLGVTAASPTFTADRGYAFDGVAQYIDTNWNVSTRAKAMSAGHVRVSNYERTNVSAATYAVGVSIGANRIIGTRPRSTSTSLAGFAGSAIASFTIAANSQGLSVVSGNGGLGSQTISAWKNGVALTDATGITIGTTLPTVNFFINALNTSGTAGSFRASTQGYVDFGSPLSTTQEAAVYAALQVFLTAVGANV